MQPVRPLEQHSLVVHLDLMLQSVRALEVVVLQLRCSEVELRPGVGAGAVERSPTRGPRRTPS